MSMKTGSIKVDYDSESLKWFEKNAPDFPDVFGWWFDCTDEHM